MQFLAISHSLMSMLPKHPLQKIYWATFVVGLALGGLGSVAYLNYRHTANRERTASADGHLSPFPGKPKALYPHKRSSANEQATSGRQILEIITQITQANKDNVSAIRDKILGLEGALNKNAWRLCVYELTKKWASFDLLGATEFVAQLSQPFPWYVEALASACMQTESEQHSSRTVLAQLPAGFRPFTLAAFRKIFSLHGKTPEEWGHLLEGLKDAKFDVNIQQEIAKFTAAQLAASDLSSAFSHMQEIDGVGPRFETLSIIGETLVAKEFSESDVEQLYSLPHGDAAFVLSGLGAAGGLKRPDLIDVLLNRLKEDEANLAGAINPLLSWPIAEADAENGTRFLLSDPMATDESVAAYTLLWATQNPGEAAQAIQKMSQERKAAIQRLMSFVEFSEQLSPTVKAAVAQ